MQRLGGGAAVSRMCELHQEAQTCIHSAIDDNPGCLDWSKLGPMLSEANDRFAMWLEETHGEKISDMGGKGLIVEVFRDMLYDCFEMTQVLKGKVESDE